MKERPILFSGPMVRALLEGRKTQTRRVVKFTKYPEHTLLTAPEWTQPGQTIWLNPADPMGAMCSRYCPYGVPGDRLWVKETWGKSTDARGTGVVRFPADDSARFALAEDGGEGDWCGLAGIADASRCHPCDRWRPSILMPRWASRLTLEVVSVRVERLQAISEEDAVNEGVETHAQRYASEYADDGSSPPGVLHGRVPWYRYDGEPCAATSARHSFETLWESINGKGSWDANPWVWVIGFRRIGGTP